MRTLLDFRENRLGFVARFDEEALGEVFFGVIEGVKDHGLDLFVGESVGGLDFDFGSQAAALLAC